MEDKTIWKYELQPVDSQNIQMPVEAEILTLQVQNGQPQLWALVDPNAEMTTRHIEMFGTGNIIPPLMTEKRRYIGTYQHGKHLIFHVFERIV